MKYELSLTFYLIPTHLNYHFLFSYKLANNGKEMQHNTTHSATQHTWCTQHSTVCNTKQHNTHSAHNTIHIVHTTQYSVQHNTIHKVQHKHIEKHTHSAYLYRRRKIFFWMWAKHSENQICVGGDVVLFIMFFLNYNK